ncbi:sensor histidine kinase [Pedobacter sp. AW31-3R]|uniref:sensor histidine kinase n=1 Tax=Pedobacter sp. AW31-3R TaxID=3445781 RepID=UPI003F9F3B67
MSGKHYPLIMHPAIKTLLACLLIGLSFGGYLYMTYDPHWQRVVTSLVSTVIIGSLMMICIYKRRYFLWITPHQSIKMLVMIVMLCVIALNGTELTLWFQVLLQKDSSFVLFRGGNIYILNILIVLVTGIPIYVSEEAKENLNMRLVTQQYRLLQLEKQQTEAELELLRAKINPHFLYNVHNTIAGLISTDPTRAEQMILLLSKFFRSTLSKTSAGLHQINDELDIIETYLQLQQIRYGSRLRYEIVIDPEIRFQRIPSFILQPLVENAVKHGIEQLASAGLIHVQIRIENQKLILEVGDSGPDFPDLPGTGHGLTIIMNKLKLLYENNYTLELINNPNKYVRITLPQTN